MRQRRGGKAALKRLWEHPLNEKFVRGIDGTLFYRMEFKREFYPTKRESDLDRVPIGRPPVPEGPIDYDL